MSSSKKRIMSALRSAWLSGKKTPLIITLAVNSKSNIQSPLLRPLPEGEPTFDELTRIMEHAAEAGAARINFDGGQPLLRDDIGQLINYALKLGLEADLWLHGGVWDLVEKNIDKLMGIRAVVIGLDGPIGTHDAIWGEGAFSYAVGAARILNMKGIRTSFENHLMKDAIFELELMVETSERMRIPIAYRPAPSHMSTNPDENSMVDNYPQYRKTIDFLIDAKNEGRPIQNTLKGLKHLKNWPDEAKLGKCLWGYVHCNVDPKLCLSMCHEGVPEPPSICLRDVEDFMEAFRQLAPSKCSYCWGSSRCDMYQAAKGRLALTRLGMLWKLIQGPRIG